MKNLALILIAIVIVSGCIGSQNAMNKEAQPAALSPEEKCVELCREQISAGVDLNYGPCLSEMEGVEWDVDDWACDVAHQPRKDIDNNSKYQCQEYRKGNVNHFVEVTPNCEFIRKL